MVGVREKDIDCFLLTKSFLNENNIKIQENLQKNIQAHLEDSKDSFEQQHAPVAIYPRETPGTHFTGGWVGLRAGVDGRKISSPPEFDPGPSSP